MRVALNLTHRCNLACTYCYSGESSKSDMTFETATRAIDFALVNNPNGDMLDIGFFGGEPLLCFNIMQKITAYLRKAIQDRDTPFQLNLTTNGTIVSQPILDFLKKEKVNLTVSLDGSEMVHDLNRCFKNGRGSFQIISRNIGKFKEYLDFVQVNAVFGPDTVEYLPETLAYFLGDGLFIIHINPNITAQWTEEAYSKLPDIYARVGELYIDSFQKGQEISINMIDSKVVLFLKGGYSAEDRCGMGETEWGFAPGGNIYPCERLVGRDFNSPHCLGNVSTGIDRDRQCVLLKERGNNNVECSSCNLRKYCMNWCGCTNYHMTGRTNMVAPMLCKSERAAIKTAKDVFISLKDNEIFGDHLVAYLNNGRHQ